MSSQDLHNSIKQAVGLNITAISTNTTTVGAIIDTATYESLEFIALSGTITDGTYTPKLEHGDDAALADAAEVPADFRKGTYANATFVAADDNTAKRIGYVGKKRYVRLSYVSTGVSSGGTLGAVAVLGNPRVHATSA